MPISNCDTTGYKASLRPGAKQSYRPRPATMGFGMRWSVLAGVVAVAGCGAVPTPGQMAEASSICAQAPTATMSNRANCERLMATLMNGIDRNLGGRGPVAAAQASLRPVSPYGPTMMGLKGLSPGRVNGDTSFQADADTVMAALQLLDATSQVQKRTPDRAEVLQAALGERLRLPTK